LDFSHTAKKLKISHTKLKVGNIFHAVPFNLTG
jgi:hypothetical protein